MLTGVIQEQGIEEMYARLKAAPEYFDCFELRLDACQDLNLAGLRRLPRVRPLLFTLRPEDQGGAWNKGEEARQEMLLELATLQPAYMDVEYTVSPERIEAIRMISPATRIILSYHNFTETPQDLEAILASMRQTAPDAIYKIATMACSTLDTLRMLLLCKKYRPSLIGICMGPDGEATRILAPVLGAGFSYCPVTAPSAPGQLSATTLIDAYNFPNLNVRTKIYGLLGDPVEHSIGHLFHNEHNRLGGENAVYVKWRLSPEELSQAIPLLKELRIAGLSVTMPLKEHVLPFLEGVDSTAEGMNAVNTIVTNEKLDWHGWNTDALGAVRALNMPLREKTVVVLGAGGAARAIVHEIKKEASRVIVLNRTLDKAKKLGVEALPLEELSELNRTGYDCLINTLPGDAPLPLGEKTFRSGASVMDITYAGESVLLKKAKEAGCTCIDGKAMFREQALLQRRLWKLEPCE